MMNFLKRDVIVCTRNVFFFMNNNFRCSENNAFTSIRKETNDVNLALRRNETDDNADDIRFSQK